jgi:hypothetical protein
VYAHFTPTQLARNILPQDVCHHGYPIFQSRPANQTLEMIHVFLPASSEKESSFVYQELMLQ